MIRSIVAGVTGALCCAALAWAATVCAAQAAADTDGPALRLRAFDPGTGERFVLSIAWESWPHRSDPVRRCRQAAAYLGGEIARRMTVEQVTCGD